MRGKSWVVNEKKDQRMKSLVFWRLDDMREWIAHEFFDDALRFIFGWTKRM